MKADHWQQTSPQHPLHQCGNKSTVFEVWEQLQHCAGPDNLSESLLKEALTHGWWLQHVLQSRVLHFGQGLEPSFLCRRSASLEPPYERID
jgi:hypothetical protein